MQVYDLRLDAARCDPQTRERYRQPEAAGPGASRIEVKHAIARLYHSSVGVADHNHCGAVGYRVEGTVTLIGNLQAK